MTQISKPKDSKEEIIVSHYDLCQLAAAHYSKSSVVTLFEYKTMYSEENPDVLCFDTKTRTRLFEIKTSRADFLADAKKGCRISLRPARNGARWFGEPVFIEKPHLGIRRYYICPDGLIAEKEVKNGWGLIYYENNRFRIKKESATFRRNMFAEQYLLLHAIRNVSSGEKSNIIVKKLK